MCRSLAAQGGNSHLHIFRSIVQVKGEPRPAGPRNRRSHWPPLPVSGLGTSFGFHRLHGPEAATDWSSAGDRVRMGLIARNGTKLGLHQHGWAPVFSIPKG